MLKIRLQRSGRKNRPNYRIVVAEHSAPIKGRYLEMLGTFDPLVDKHGLVVDTAKVEEWIKKGAKPTNTLARLLKGQGVKGMDSFVVDMKDKAVKNPKEIKEPVAPVVPATPVAQAPAVEEKIEDAPTEEAPAAVEEAPAEEVSGEDEKPEEEK